MKKITVFSFITILAIIIGCTEHKYPDLGGGYKLDSDGKYSLQILNSQNTVMVGAHILEYAFDSTFIVVSQRPWNDPSILGINEMTYSKRRIAFENSIFRQYWIINKKEKSEYSLDTLSKFARYSNVYGPFKKEEYLMKSEALNIPKTLEIK